MLYRLHRLAVAIFPARKFFLFLAGAGLLSGLYAAVAVDDLYSWQLRLSFVFALWALMLFSFVQLFRTIPPPVLPKLGFFERLAGRLRLLPYHVLGLVIIGLTLLLVQMSLKLLML